MNNGKIKFRGSIVAVVTPFDKSGHVDEKLFVEHVQRLMEEGAGGILVAGSTGEAWALDPAEKIRLFALARSALGRDALVLGGTGEIRTDRTIEVSLAAKEAGVDGVLIVPPYFVDRTRQSVIAHFRSISNSIACPIVVYNHPGSTGVNLDESYLEELSALEWLVATKESAGDFHQLCRLINDFSDRIDVLTGYSVAQGAFGVMMGSPAAISSVEPQILGREGISLLELARVGKFKEAIELQKKCQMVAKIMSIGIAPANLKAAMRLVGRPAGYCRSPVVDLSSRDVARVAELLNAAGVTPSVEAAA